MSTKELNLIGLMLYAGEGAKTGKTVDFVNANPLVIQTFLTYLRTVHSVDEQRLRFYLYCFSNQKAEDLITFWSNLLEVDELQFTKPYIKKCGASIKRSLEYGVLHVRYSDKKLLLNILREVSAVMVEYRDRFWVGSEAVKRS